jgi:hypothetical protein
MNTAIPNLGTPYFPNLATPYLSSYYKPELHESNKVQPRIETKFLMTSDKNDAKAIKTKKHQGPWHQTMLIPASNNQLLPLWYRNTKKGE